MGESEKALQTLFEAADARAPCILLLDDVDALFHRGGGGALLAAQLARCLDAAAPGVVVLATTNALGRVDPALVQPRRFEQTLALAPLAAADRAAVLTAVQARRAWAAEASTAARAADFVARTAGCTGAQLLAAVRHAYTVSARRGLAGADFGPLAAADLDAALAGLAGAPGTGRHE